MPADHDQRSLIQALFRVAKGETDARAFCKALKASVEADAVNIAVSDAQSLQLLANTTCGSPLLPQIVFDEYNRRWLQSDPQVRLALSKKLPHGEVYICSEHFSAEARRQEPFFSELLAGLGLAWCAGYLSQLDDQYAFGFLAYRAVGRPPFDAAAKRTLTPIAEIYENAGNAIVIAQRAATRERASLMALDAGARAALCLDHRGRLLWATHAARHALSSNQPLQLKGDRLTAHDADGLRHLKDLARQASLGARAPAPAYLTLHHPDTHHTLPISVQAVRADGQSQWGAALITLDPPIETQAEAALSTREREIIAKIASGLTAAAAARDMGIAEASARTFLRRAFRKLGVRNQRELLRRLTQGSAPTDS